MIVNVDKPEIEIYLPKERIVSKDGTELIREWVFREDLKNDEYFIEENKYYLKYARYDTLNNNYIYAGSFVADKSDLKEEPFIKNDEIIEFDFKKSLIKFSPSGVEKIWNLPPNFNFSRQFIITADKEPILTGYFYSIFASSYVSHFYIVYDGSNDIKSFPKKYEEREYKIFHNQKTQKEFHSDDEFDFRTKLDFYKAFELSGRIAE